MFTLFKYEMKNGLKNFFIWTLSVGLIGFVCILLFKSLETNMADMADSFASMGAFSEALGMNALSIATLPGFFATEIATVHALGGCLFAASIATVLLSKEEDGHTAEFTFSLPVSRGKVVFVKYISLIANILAFSIICGGIYHIGCLIVSGEGLGTEFLIFMASQCLMNIEIGTICFMLSAFFKKNKLGIGIGLGMILYIFDLMASVIPDLKKIIAISPFAYANAPEIFTKTADSASALIIGVGLIIITCGIAFITYTRRDLAS